MESLERNAMQSEQQRNMRTLSFILRNNSRNKTHVLFSVFRTKWKRQTAVGLELLAEAGNYAAVQRMLQSNPYWFTYHPQAASIISNLDALYYRAGTDNALQGQRPTLPRMFIHGIQQHINHLPSPNSIFGENRN